MRRRRLTGTAGAALCALSLHACVPAQELPEAGLARILGAVGIADVTFKGREYEVNAVRLVSAKGRVPIAKGYVLSAPEIRGTRVERTNPSGWQSESVILTDVGIASGDEPDGVRATLADLAFEPVRTETTGTAWRGVRANRVAFLDGDGSPDLTIERVVMRWNPVGGDGNLRLTVVVDGIVARPSWVAGLGAGPCLVGALTGSGPLDLRMGLEYKPSDGSVTIESATLAGRGGAVGLTLSLGSVPAEFATPARILSTLLDMDGLPEAVRFKGMALDYRDAGVAAACFSAVPSLDPADPARSVETLSTLPFLAEERDRTGFAHALAAFAAEPSRLRLWLNPNEALSLRYLASALTSPARNRYLTTTLAVNDDMPVASLPADAPEQTEETQGAVGTDSAAAAATPIETSGPPR